MRIILTDLNPRIVDEWRRVFFGLTTEIADKPFAIGAHTVEIKHRDIFFEPATFVVSPANSFGFMDGGIDQVYTDRFGRRLQDRLQERIRHITPLGELLIGQAMVMSTDDEQFPMLISAPTMRRPGPIRDYSAVWLSTRAAIVAALGADGTANPATVVMPGMGALTGQVPPMYCALLMRKGIEWALNPPAFPKSWRDIQE